MPGEEETAITAPSARSSVALSGAAVSAVDAAGGPSPPLPPSSELECVQLELRQCQEKFASWKEKAKSGVDNLRAQIIELNQQLDISTQRDKSSARSYEAVILLVCEKSDLTSGHALAAASLFAEDVMRVVNAAVPSVRPSSPTPDPLVEKLQRTVQDQSDRLKEAHHALKRSTNEAQQRFDALQHQDEVLAGLRRRVESLEAINTSLEEQLMNVPNVDEWRAAKDELDHQLERSRLEFESRESNLVMQHSNEIQALNALHEQEIRELQQDAQERISQAVQNMLASQAQAAAEHGQAQQRGGEQQHEQSNSQPGGGGDDAAYLDLLRDYKTLEASLAAAERDRDAVLSQQKLLLRELQDLFRAIGSGGIAASSTPSLESTVNAAPASMTMEDAVRHVGEQRVRFLALQEELSRCHREVVQLKRSKRSAPQDGLGGQQAQYLRSVVVQLLCSLNDATVAKRLLPVLSMLLKFSDDDLKVVTKAMPQWTHRR